MIEGRRYRFRYRTQAANYRWVAYEVVADFAKEDERTGEVFVSLRPLAGTGRLNRNEFIFEPEEVSTNIAVHLPRRLDGFTADPNATNFEKPALPTKEISISEMSGQGIRTINNLLEAKRRAGYEHNALIEMRQLFEKIKLRSAILQQELLDARNRASHLEFPDTTGQ